MEVFDQNVQPPAHYNERQIQKDLVRLSAKGYSIVPYQRRIKSKLYYRFYRKRIEAFFELVKAEASVWQAMREWKTEVEKLKMVDKDIEILRREKDVRNLELEIKQLELEKKRQSLSSQMDDDQELAAIRRKEEIAKAQLRLAKAENQLDELNNPPQPESSIVRDVNEKVGALQGITEILKAKQQCESNLKKYFSSQGLKEAEVNQMIDEFDRIAREEGILTDRGM
ncbi:MAG: hypothetical protein GF353_18165 [Candidatus Lokiarchaeota archaeon]|nr:hypothetical protein [Candidatus Lokiarchaeota archaeon]